MIYIKFNRSSKMVLSFHLLLVMLTFSHSFLVRKIYFQPTIDCWFSLYQLNVVASSRITAITNDGSDITSAVPNNISNFEDPVKMQRSTSYFDLLISSENVIEFTSLLKQLAAKKRYIQDCDKPAITRAVVERLDEMTDELFSDCVWSIGTLRWRVSDFDTITSNIKETNSTLNFWNMVIKVSKTAEKVCFLRLAIGLSRMGLTWKFLPLSTRTALLNLIKTQDESSTQIASQKQRIPIQSKDIVTILYTYGQLGVTVDLLPEGSLNFLLEEVADITNSLTPQGYSNTLHGLAHMGVMWAVLPTQTKTQLSYRGGAVVHEMRSDELCSVMNSMAVMKNQWSSLSLEYRTGLLIAVEVVLPTFNHRELSNIFWSMGKMNINYSEDLSVSFIDTLTASLSEVASTLKLFDLESVFVGLGLMQVQFNSLSSVCQEILIRRVEHHLVEMNIFCTYNVIWGLARMGVSTEVLGSSLSSLILEKVVSIIHTFLPTQYGDVLWSMGTLGYRKENFNQALSDRLLAVLSRVYGLLHVRAAAYTLWGLSKIGYQWSDMQKSTRSLAGGREAEPMSDSVNRYLKQRVCSMREHEYSVLLYSLGGLKAQLQGKSALSLPLYVTDKIHHRATRVCTFISSRSLANALYGMGKSGVQWINLPIETRVAWEEALSSSNTSMNRNRNQETELMGLSGMRAVELAQTLYGLGQMRVPWTSLALNTREALKMIGLPNRVGMMGLHAISSGLWGFAAMSCPLSEVPSGLLAAARERLWNFNSTAVADVQDSVDLFIDDSDSKDIRTYTIPTVYNQKTCSPSRIQRRSNRSKQLKQSISFMPPTTLEEAGLSLSMGLEAMASLQVSLRQDELHAVSERVEYLSSHMNSDTIISCAMGLNGLGVILNDISATRKYAWVSRLENYKGNLTTVKRQYLTEPLNANKI